MRFRTRGDGGCFGSTSIQSEDMPEALQAEVTRTKTLLLVYPVSEEVLHHVCIACGHPCVGVGGSLRYPRRHVLVRFQQAPSVVTGVISKGRLL